MRDGTRGEGSNLEKTEREPLACCYSPSVASPPSSFPRGRLQSAAHICVRPWREITPARYLRPRTRPEWEGEKKSHRHNDMWSLKSEKIKNPCAARFRAAIRFARRYCRSNGGEPIGVITHVADRSPLAGRAFVIRGEEREREGRKKNDASEECGFHYAGGISYRCFVSANSANPSDGGTTPMNIHHPRYNNS